MDRYLVYKPVDYLKNCKYGMATLKVNMARLTETLFYHYDVKEVFQSLVGFFSKGGRLWPFLYHEMLLDDWSRNNRNSGRHH